MPTIDFVIPVFNEEESVLALHKQLEALRLEDKYIRRYIYVNDGSADRTQQILEGIAAADERVSVLQLSRNFGHQAALSAGLEASRGDIVVSLDGDGQHPASLIPDMLQLYEEGYDLVNAQRMDAFDNVNLFKRLTSKWFYRLVSTAGEIHLVPGASDFRLHSRRAIDALLRLPEYHRFYRGMAAWIGFPTAIIPYKPALRIGGSPKYSLKKMLRLASDGFFSFSLAPLRIALFLGLFFILMAGAELLYVAFVWFAGPRNQLVPGWTSLVLILTVSSAINMILLGILGIYIGMIFYEVKGRPVYLLQSGSPDNPRTASGPVRRS